MTSVPSCWTRLALAGVPSLSRDALLKATLPLLMPAGKSCIPHCLFLCAKAAAPAPSIPTLCARELEGAVPQGWSGTGYFVEDKESLGANPLKSAEQKKLLSAVEKSGLLSRAEKAGLTLSRVRLGGRPLPGSGTAHTACNRAFCSGEQACMRTTSPHGSVTGPRMHPFSAAAWHVWEGQCVCFSAILSTADLRRVRLTSRPR